VEQHVVVRVGRQTPRHSMTIAERSNDIDRWGE
jgi:hypothetical protein